MQYLKNFNKVYKKKIYSYILLQIWLIVRIFFFNNFMRYFNCLRKFILIIFGAKIGKKVIIRPTADIYCPWNLTLGDYSWIGDHVYIYSLNKIKIGSNTCVSQKTILMAGNHDYKSMNFENIECSQIIIGNNCWIAANTFVGPNIKIGNNTVVGCSSNVVKNLPANSFCYGSPAKKIKKRYYYK